MQIRSGAVIDWPHERDVEPVRLLAADRPSSMTMGKTVVKANNALGRAQSEARRHAPVAQDHAHDSR